MFCHENTQTHLGNHQHGAERGDPVPIVRSRAGQYHCRHRRIQRNRWRDAGSVYVDRRHCGAGHAERPRGQFCGRRVLPVWRADRHRKLRNICGSADLVDFVPDIRRAVYRCSAGYPACPQNTDCPGDGNGGNRNEQKNVRIYSFGLRACC